MTDVLSESAKQHAGQLSSPPCDPRGITQIPELASDELLLAIQDGEVEQMCIVIPNPSMRNQERPDDIQPKTARVERFAAQSWEKFEASDSPVLALTREFADVFSDNIPSTLPKGRGVRHETDLAPGLKCCITRQ